MKLPFTLENGVLSYDKKAFANQKAMLSNKDKKVHGFIEFYETKGKRSLNTNALFHKWLSELSKFNGDDISVMKYRIKQRANFGIYQEIDGQTVFLPKTSSKANVDEMKALMAECQKLSIFLECKLSWE